MTAAANGDLFVADAAAPRVARVNASGTVTTFAPLPLPDVLDVVVDGLGDLLIAAGDSGVWRLTPGAVRTRFASGLFAVGVTVGPDGDVWVGGFTGNAAEVRRYDPSGTPKDTINVDAMDFAFDLAFSPAGDLYASNQGDGVFRITASGPVRVITAGPYLEGLAFDRDGYLYVSNGFLGEVLLYDAAFQPVHEPFARQNLGGPINLVFGRDATGAMTSRLFAANVGYNLSPPYAGGIVEMNPAGIRAPGFRVGIDLLRMATTSLRPGVMGALYADTLRLMNPPGPVTWSVTAGSLPPSLTLDAATGAVSGLLDASGSFNFTVRGTSGGQFGTAALTLVVTRPQVPLVDAANAFLGVPGAVTADVVRFFDLQGNNNGRLDIADFRAYLRSVGQLPAAAARRAQP